MIYRSARTVKMGPLAPIIGPLNADCGLRNGDGSCTRRRALCPPTMFRLYTLYGWRVRRGYGRETGDRTGRHIRAVSRGVGAQGTVQGEVAVLLRSMTRPGQARFFAARNGTGFSYRHTATDSPAPWRTAAKVSDIQSRLGHSSLATTGRYLQALRAAENPQAAALTALLGLGDAE